MKRFFLGYLAMLVLLGPLGGIALTVAPAPVAAAIESSSTIIDEEGNTVTLREDHDGEEAEGDAGVDDDYLQEFETKRVTNDFYHLATLTDAFDRIEIAPQDEEKLRNFQVDIRVTEYLINLVLPEEFGGAGFKHIKVNRLFKNYDSDGVGKYDRETADAVEEDDRYISSHHRGQAVDISEVGDIKCKLVQRRHLGGSTTKWQQPRAVKVAWQSVDGISRHPTPKSPSLMESSAALTADGILRMLNDSGEMDAYVEYVKGTDLQTILTYVGANIFLKNAEATKITGDPLSDSLVGVLGAAMLEKSLSSLPDGFIAQDGKDNPSVAVMRARLEDALSLPAGTLRGKGWDEILQNAGERVLENAAGLPSLFFESHSLEEANRLDTFRAALRHFAAGDRAFDVIDGAIDKVKKNDKEGLEMAGVNAIAFAFKLTEAQRQELETAVKQNRRPDIDPTSFAVGKEFPAQGLRLFFSDNPTEQNEALKQLEEMGREYLREAVRKSAPRQYEGITTEVLDMLIGSKKATVDEVKQQAGANKLAHDYGLTPREVQAFLQGKGSSKVESRIADELNKEFGLKDKERITTGDVRDMTARRDYSLIEKIGGAQADQAVGWNSGTGLDLIQGKKKLDEAAGEIFANAYGQILGLNQGTEFSLKGDLQKNYGQALLEQKLGLDFSNKRRAGDFDKNQLLGAFGLSTGRSLTELKDNDEFWTRPETVRQLALADARLGADSGTSEGFLRDRLDADQLKRKVAADNAENVAIDQVWNFFDLESQFHLKKEEGALLLGALSNWDNTEFEKKDQAIKLVYKIMGRSFDSKTNFAIDFFATYFTEPDRALATEKLIDQGIRQFALAVGVNLEEFDKDDLKAMTDRIIRIFNNDARPAFPATTPGISQETRDGDERTLINQLLKATKIPEKYRADAAAFVDGDFRTGLAGWSATMWTDFANKYLPEGAKLSYEEMRSTFDFTDTKAVEKRADELVAEGGQNATGESRAEILAEARRQLIQESRDNAQYKLSDAFIEQAAGQDIPANFSRVMFTGSDQERGDLLIRFGLTRIDSALKAIEPSYQEGTLEKIYKGQLSSRDADQLVLSIINRSGVSFGDFDTEFIGQFYRFIRSQGNPDFFTNPNYNGMWNYFDSWFEKTLGVGDLPIGLTRSVYHASQHGWDPNRGITGTNGQVVVPSLNQLGENFLVSKVSDWGDKQFGLPSGSTFRMYQAIKSLDQAQRAYAAAQTAQRAAALKSAQANLTLVVITIALNACDACQQFFASIDKAIAAPPGFTNMAVAGAIAMSLGLGPAGLIAAAVIYLVGVYRVDYLCPIPPPDRFALTQFDTPADKLDYTWGDYYADETTVVKDVPAPGENPFDWDEGLPFADGNDPNLWRAWARYNTGRLLEATMQYGENRERPHKPLQVITFRQANVEFFHPRSAATFGSIERIFPSVGLGYSQSTTKTTDWVHVAFGGWF